VWGKGGVMWWWEGQGSKQTHPSSHAQTHTECEKEREEREKRERGRERVYNGQTLSKDHLEHV